LVDRIRRFGEIPCAFVLGATGGMVGGNPSLWFGKPIFWDNPGWRLGVEGEK
jgi:hypothetical protein